MEEITFNVGDSFPSTEAVKQRVELYSKQTHVPLSISDGRTIQSAISSKRMSKSISEQKAELLHYYEVKFTCIHGGRKHRKRGTGQRKSSTFRIGCPCFISFWQITMQRTHSSARQLLDRSNYTSAKISIQLRKSG